MRQSSMRSIHIWREMAALLKLLGVNSRQPIFCSNLPNARIHNDSWKLIKSELVTTDCRGKNMSSITNVPL